MTQSLKTAFLERLEGWDEFVKNHPLGSPLLLSNNLKTIASAYGIQLTVLAILAEEKVIAGVPVFFFSKFGLELAHRNYLLYQPLLSPFSTETNSKMHHGLNRRKAVHLLAEILKTRFATLSFRFFPEEIDVRPFLWEGFDCSPKHTLYIPLSPGQKQTDYLVDRKIKRLKEIEEKFEIKSTSDYSMVGKISSEVLEKKKIDSGLHTPKRMALVLSGMGRHLDLRVIRERKNSIPWAVFGVLTGFRKQILAVASGAKRHPQFSHLNRYLISNLLVEKAKQGFTSLDMNGIDVAPLAAFKEKFIGQVMTHYEIKFVGPKWLKALWAWRRRF